MAKMSFGDSRQVKNFDLTSPVSIAKDDGTITGAPTFSRDGCDFDGTNDWISYAISPTFFNMVKISIIAEFTPDFDYDVDENHYIYDSTTGHRYLAIKANVANSLTLQIFLGNTSVASIPSATYSPYWKQNERNVLVVSGTTGATNAWLNGTQILTNDASAWAPAQPTNLFVGSSTGGASKFDGEIHSISIKNDLTTAQEALDLYNRSTFNFQNKADVWLDMKSQVGKESGTGLLTDGDMEAVGTAAWTEAQNPTVTKETGTRTGGSGSQVLKVAYGSSPNPRVYQGILIAGKRYRARGWARSDGTQIATIGSGAAITYHWASTNSTSWQYFDEIFTVIGGSAFFLQTTGSAGYTEWDDVTVELIEQTTKDKSGNGNDFLLGDGNTTTTFPAFLNPGFSFDGGDYLQCTLADPAGTDDITLGGLYDFTTITGANYRFMENGKIIWYLAAGKIAFSSDGGVTAAGSDDSLTKGKHVVLVTRTAAGAVQVYVDGFAGSMSATASGTPAAGTYGMKLAGNSAQMVGKRYCDVMFSFMLTPTQIRAITNDLLRRYS